MRTWLVRRFVLTEQGLRASRRTAQLLSVYPVLNGVSKHGTSRGIVVAHLFVIALWLGVKDVALKGVSVSLSEWLLW